MEVLSADESPHPATHRTLHHLNPASLLNQYTNPRGTLDRIVHGCVGNTAELSQRFIRQYAPALANFARDIFRWIRGNPGPFIAILGGTTLTVLVLASPAILGAIGFSSIGPVAGSIAAGWQASIGLVAANSLFAFLQSAAMGGAAMGLLLGVGGLVGGSLVVVGVGWSLVGGRIGGLVEEVKEGVGRVVDDIKGAVGGWADGLQRATGGWMESCVASFGKRKDA